MKVVACVPFWLEYDKNNIAMKKLGGELVLNHTLKKLEKVKNIDESVLFCSNSKVFDFITTKKKISFLKRDAYLNAADISIEDILSSFLHLKDADIYVLIHPNCPFIKEKTIEECVSKVLNDNYDSAFTAIKLQKFAWFEGERLNYKEDQPTPNKNTIPPVIIEQGSIYVFKKEAFLKCSRRICENPYIKFINHYEGHEVIDMEDFETAELIINSGMNLE